MNHHYDPEEIEKFEALAREWWNPDGKFRPLHRINPIRLDYIAGHHELQGAETLDVGCGGGILAEAMATRGAKVTGIDRSEKALAVARLHARESGWTIGYHCSDAETWAETHSDTYDVVTCMEVLEHVPDVESTVEACVRMLKPGGAFFFATLNRTVKSFLVAIVGAEYVLNWLPKGTHHYDKFVRPSELVGLLRRAGLEVEDLRGMSFEVLSNRFALSDDLSVNYLGYARKPRQ
jgi:2-polyprenyl-6-hydroxyphenyl methylase/3-demethylubiquinone-9 3-methyltransferase